MTELRENEDLQDILARNLESAIQACIDLAAHLCGAHGIVPETAGEAFDRLVELGLIEPALAAALRRAVGFRNVLVHEYTAIDWEVVMQVVRIGTDDLSTFGKAVTRLVGPSDRAVDHRVRASARRRR